MSAIIYQFQPMAELPNRIREWRKARGLTLEAVALAINCSIPQVSQLERGTTPLTLDWMAAIARALRVEVTDLLPAEHAGGILSAEERDLIERYRGGDDHQQAQLRAMADVIVPYTPEPDFSSAA